MFSENLVGRREARVPGSRPSSISVERIAAELWIEMAENVDLVNVFGHFYPKLRSYSLNAYAGWATPWDARLSTAYKIFRKHSAIPPSMSAGMFLFGDVNPNSICWPYFGVQMAQDSFFNFPGASHNRGGVFSFADGHSEHHRWRDSRTITAYS